MKEIEARLPNPSLRPDKQFYGKNPTLYPHQLNVASFLITNSHNLVPEDKILFYFENAQTWCYRDFYDQIEICASNLLKLGLKPGNRLLAHSYNSPWLAALWFATILIGGIIILTPPQLKSAELKPLLLHAQISMAFADPEIFESLQVASREIALSNVFLIEDLFIDSSEIDRRKVKPFDSVKDDIAVIAYTSGSTGSPKATTHTHLDLITICDCFPKQILQPSTKDIFAGTPPLGFTFGLGALLLFPIRYGASTLLLRKPSPELLSTEINSCSATLLFSTPTGYRMLLQFSDHANWPSLRLCVSAGEHLSKATQIKWESVTKVPLINGIGSTEMLHIFISSTPYTSKPGSTGKPLNGYLAKIIDEHGRTLNHGEIGLLAVKGPTGCCYLDNESAQKQYVQDGWNITGDLFYQDNEGYFYFYDRYDDLIITSGYKVSAQEVENKLLESNMVNDAAVIGIHDPLRGKVIKTFLVLKPDINIEDIQCFMKENIAHYKCPKIYEIRPELPKTNTGKLQRFSLREPAGA